MKKKKLLKALLVFGMSMVTATALIGLTACDDHTHVDEDGNGKCDVCDTDMTPGGEGGELEVAVTKVELDQTSLTLDIGDEVTLHATVSPETATDKTVTYTVSPAGVVTVGNDGKVTAIADGDATITATAAGGKTATCTVHVNEPAPQPEIDADGWIAALSENAFQNFTAVQTVKDDPNSESELKADLANGKYQYTDGEGYVYLVKEEGDVYYEYAIAEGDTGYTKTETTAENYAEQIYGTEGPLAVLLFKDYFTSVQYNSTDGTYEGTVTLTSGGEEAEEAEEGEGAEEGTEQSLGIVFKFDNGKLVRAEIDWGEAVTVIAFSKYGTTEVNLPKLDGEEDPDPGEDPEPTECEHVDADEDGKCDKCGEDMPNGGNQGGGEEGGGDQNVTVITDWASVDNPVHTPGDLEGEDTIWHHIFVDDAVSQKYDFDSYEATVTVGGNEGVIVEAQPFESSAAAAHTYHLQIRIKGTQYQDTVFSIKFKKGEEVVATGTYTRAGDKEIVLDSVAETVSVGDTTTINITSVNGKTDLTGLAINWAIADTEGTGVATIPANSNGNSVVVTAAAVGKATLTCTIGEGEGAFSKTCVITVQEGDVVIEAVDVSTQATFNNKFTSTGEAVQLYFNLQDAKYADLVQQIDPSKTTVEVTMDGNASTSTISRKEWQAQNLYNLWIQVVVESDWNHDYVFRFSFKNAKGDEVAYGTYSEIAPKAINLSSSTLSVTVGDEAKTVTATKTNAVSGNITWSIDSTDYATIVDNGDGTVTVTAVAKGTATLTASADGIEKTCTVNVLEKGDETPVPTITSFSKFEGPYGENYYKFRFEENDPLVDNYPEYKTSFDHVNVDGALTAHREFFQGGGAKTYIVTVKFNSAPVTGTTYKIDLCDASDNVIVTFSWTA